MNVTVKEQIRIEATPDEVWDYTQDWRRRREWDPSVLGAEILEESPPVVRVRAAGWTRFVARYKQYERPHKTSLAMTDTRSCLISGGGGSWEYSPDGAATIFAQVNTLRLRNRLFFWLYGWLVRWQLARATRIALARAKARIEGRREV